MYFEFINHVSVIILFGYLAQQAYVSQSTRQLRYSLLIRLIDGKNTLDAVNLEEEYDSANWLPADAIEFTTPLALFLMRLSSFFSLSQLVSVMNCLSKEYMAAIFLSRHEPLITTDSSNL
jgi:hypothetical protein